MGEPAINADTITNRTFAEITIGEQASLTRTLKPRDIQLFATLSGDLNPTHLDESFARTQQAGKLTAPSMWAASLTSGLFGSQLPGPGSIFAAQSFRYLHPVYLNDTLTLTAEVREKRPESRVVVFACTAINQRNETVMEATIEVIAPAEKIVTPRPELASMAIQTHDKFRRLLEHCTPLPDVITAVVHPCDESSLTAAVEAAEASLIVPILIGPSDKIRATADQYQIDIRRFEIVDVPHSHAAAAKAVELVRNGQAEVLMKGSLHTDELMHEAMRADTGLRTGSRVSHVFCMDVPSYHKLLLVTDAAINIYPTLDEKRDICQNAIDLALVLGIKQPKVAILSAVETISTKIASTTDAASLCKMADRRQITGGLLDGPLAFDNAISKVAATIKGIKSEVAGDADILLVPDLEAGNILVKQLTFMAHADGGGIVVGIRVPLILTSRADNIRIRLASCAIAVLVAHARRSGQ
ncbi:bifunctional enoyl-CoA hydratase/phosphate acetyltransferase [Candidatus Contendibacter odensensis]|uniref:Phosphate acetyl/butyryltransferase n=1 Tax=Candidatus Contendobacter odensis Run_B_J11 TaxID=1400861 RepID=A0A7U7GFM1_9GAMM|nr:bifunctional enoyl-CoA hydratase/phosphate acetyltransferase [Candidatus Contendobacter odensis]CDH47512.1 putative Phosphate acetyl/butyryltransferase [Candidatus Contendobacter odensis Run_B_J11]